MRIKNFEFSPSLVPTVVTLVLLPLLISLGVWQLDRADEKREIEAVIHQAQLKDALQLNTVLDTSNATSTNRDAKEEKDLLEEVYRPVIAVGQFDSSHQFLYDNRTHKGKPGYHVLTPFILRETQMAVLVNRGWIPYIGRRENFQDIAVDGRERTLKGVIKALSQSIVLNEEHDVDNGFPQTIQSISLETIAKQLDYGFAPIIVELGKSEKDGFVRDWQPYYGSIAKHNGYAIQWFAMAAILLLLFLNYNIKRVDS